MNYLERIRKNREFKVTVGRWTFTGRRPTDIEAGPIFRDPTSKVTLADLACDYYTGWSGVIEDDVVGGGGQDPIPFDRDLYRDWCADHPELWDKLGHGVIDAYTVHLKQLQDAEKNSQPG
jgi:hypothetical protein